MTTKKKTTAAADAYTWKLVHSDWRGKRPDEVLAHGAASTPEACRREAVEAEKKYPVAWCPELRCLVLDSRGNSAEERT